MAKGDVVFCVYVFFAVWCGGALSAANTMCTTVLHALELDGVLEPMSILPRNFLVW